MKLRKIACLLLSIMFIGCTAKTKNTVCPPVDGTQACFNIETNQFDIEENAKIMIGGLPESYGEALISLWDQSYPEYAGLLEANYDYDQANAIEAPYASYDIIFTYEELSGAYQDILYPLHELIMIETYPASYQKEKTWKDLFVGEKDTAKDSGSTDIVNAETNTDKQSNPSDDNSKEQDSLVVSALQPYYVPVAYEGAAFFYNKTMLEQLGVDVETDANQDNMPDSIETWEQIFALADAWSLKRPMYRKKPVNVVFPFSLNEHYLSYFMFTSNGFRLFPDHDGMNPGFQSESFIRALQFVTEAGKHNMAMKEDGSNYQANDYVWQWEKVFTHQIAPFGMVAPWMDLAKAAKANKVEYVVTPRLPTFQNTNMVPFVTTMGYVIKGDTNYPSAAHAVLQFLTSEKAMQLMVDHSSLIPYQRFGYNLSFEGQANRLAIQKTLAKGDSQPIIAMPNNVYKKALDGYYEIPIMEVVRRLWDGVIDPYQAQNEIQFMYQQWFFDNTNIKIPAATTKSE